MLNGFMITELWSMPRDQVAVQQQQIFAHPSTVMVMKHGRTPYWTRHMVGVSEAERDRRKNPRR